MTKTQYNKRISKALGQHQEALNKELSISEDLQNKEEISHILSNMKKVRGMIK